MTELFSDYKPGAASTNDDLFADYGANKEPKASNLQFLMDDAANQAPEQAAKSLVIQSRTGLPKKFIDENFKDLELTVQQSEFNAERFLKDSPLVADWLTKNPDYMPLMRGEIESTMSLEGTIRVAENVARSIGAAPSRAGAGLWGIAQAGAETVGADTIAGFFSEQRNSAAQIAENIRGKQEGAGFIEKAALSGVESAANTLLMLPMSIMSGSPTPLLLGMSAQTGGESYGRARDKGIGIATALGYGVSDAAVEYATEMIPASRLLKDLAGNTGLAKTLLNQWTEIVGEQVATVLQDLNEWAVMNPDSPFSEYLAERPSAAAQTLIATIVGTGVQTTAAYGGKKLVQHIEKRNYEKSAETREQFFSALADSSTNSKLRENLPDKYKEMVDHITADGPVKDIYVPLELFQTHFTEQGIDPAQLAKELGFERQYQYATETGTKLAIPTGTYAANIAPTEHHAAFQNEWSEGADIMSANESKAFFEQEDKRLKETQTPEQLDQIETELAEVMAPIREQVGAMYQKGEAETQLKLIEQKVRVRAMRTGISPVQLMKQRPLDITEGEGGTGATLNQSTKQTQTPEFKKWFGESKVVDEKGEPLVVYHGGAEPIAQFAISKTKIDGTVGQAFYFTPNPQYAGFFAVGATGAKGAPNITPVFIHAEKPVNFRDDVTQADLQHLREAGAIGPEFSLDAPITHLDMFRFLSDRDGNGKAASYYWTAGWDALVFYKTTGEETIAVRNPEQIKSAIGNRGTFDPNDPNILYQAEPQWFSALAKGLESAKQTKATAKDWKAIVSKLPNVKADEIEAVGLNEWLDMQQGSVTKEQVLEFVRQNGVQVKEVTLGAPPINRLTELDDRLRAGDSLTTEEQAEYNRMVDDEAFPLTGENKTKFASYQLPGGENYRELLLTLPEVRGQQKFDASKVTIKRNLRSVTQGSTTIEYDGEHLATYSDDPQLQEGAGWKQKSDEHWMSVAQRLFEKGDERNSVQGKSGAFRSSHFDEPNILAHVRFNERQDADGKKVLFLEEIQSDWAQKGRKEGFATKYKASDVQQITEKDDPVAGSNPDLFWYFRVPGNILQIPKSKYPTVREAARYILDEKVDKTGAPPSAPFVTKTESWSMLAMKRMIRFASESGSNAWHQVTKPDSVRKLGENILGSKMASVMPLEAVDGGVLASLQHDQVRRAVISSLPVNVVDLLSANEITPEKLFGNPDMVVSGLSVDHLRQVANGLLGAMRSVGADLRAKLLAARDAGRDRNLLPALKASDLNPREVVGLLSPEFAYHDGAALGAKESATAGTTAKDSAKLGRVSEQYLGSAALADFLNWHERILGGTGNSYQAGFDRVAWTTGEQQAARYDLSKQVDSIGYRKDGEDTYEISAIKDGESVMVEHGKTPKQLEEIVGKEVAKKIVDGEGVPRKGGGEVKDLSGIDLKVGGEGMRQFYDVMLPQMVNKYVKKWGGKVGVTDITKPEMTLSYAELQRRRAGEKPDPSKFKQAVHSLDITDSMRESVMQGQPLFQQGKDITRGSISMTETGDIIRLFKTRNLSTLLHELSHRWLFDLADDAAAPNATEQTKADLAKALEYLGLENADQLRLDKFEKGSAEFTRAVEANEKWARSFEVYLKEGKAPSQELRTVFAKIKAWMVAIYDVLKQGKLTEDLIPEIRGVFDRLLATDQEIAAVEEEANAKPFALTAIEAGMSDTEFAAYRKTLEDANANAREEVEAKAMREYKRTLKDEWKKERESTKDEVEAEVDKLPIYQTIAKMLENGVKLDSKAVKEMGLSKAIQRGLLAKDGLAPDVVAGMLNYPSGEALARELASVEKRDARVSRETEIRMNAKFGNMLEDGTLHEAAQRAVMGEDRAKIIEAEIKALHKKAREVKPFTKAQDKAQAEQESAGRDIYRGLVPKLADVRAHAKAVIQGRRVRELKPFTYFNLARQASRQAMEDMRKGDYLMAAYNKGRELLNLELYREANKARDAIEAGNEKLAKLSRPDEKLAKTRDMNMVNVARAILASHGIGRTDASPTSYLDKMREYEPLIYENLRPIFEPALADPKPYKDMTVSEYMAMHEAVTALVDIARRSRQMMVDEKLMDRQEIVEALTSRIADLNKGKIPPKLQVIGDESQKTKIGLLSIKAAMRRVESWVTAMDGGPDGPFRKYIWNPIADGVNKYRDQRRVTLERYLKMLEDVAPTLTHDPIVDEELGVKFMGKVQLLHAILHTGNESNKSKLLRGYGWGELREDGTLDSTRWDAFEKRMQDKGILTKADYDFAQNVWDLMEEMKPQLQKAHKDMYGFHFAEVTANEFSNRFGTYRGGYIPAKVDPTSSAKAESHQDADQILQGQNSFAFPTTGKGATMRRVETYAAPLQLDMKTIPSHIDWAMRFAYIEPAAKDVARVVINKDFAKSMNDMDRGVINDMLVPWLQRTAQQKTSTRGVNKHMDKFWSAIRNRTGMQIMVANVINTMQQFTGLTTALTRVKSGNLRTAFWLYMTNHKEMSEEIGEKSTFMRNRVFTAQNEILQSIEDILVNPTKYEKAKDFANKHGYFMQQATQGFVDQIVWKAAYNEAMETMSEKEAIRHADSTVRETQGSFAPEDISRVEAGTPFTRLFTMFYNYFNMQANLLGTEFSKIATNELGLRKGAGRALYVYTMAMMISAFIGDALLRAMIAGKPDDDDDGYMDDLIAMFFGSQARALMAMVPGLGPVTTSIVGHFTKKPYDDNITASPAISMVESAVRAPHSVYKAIVEDGSHKKAVKDTLVLIGMITGIPLGALGRPLGYLADVEQGKAQPESVMDMARGLVSGQDVNRRQ